MTTDRQVLYYLANSYDKRRVEPLLRLLFLPRRFETLEPNGSNLHEVWKEARLLERSAQELAQFWQNPIKYLQGDLELFLALPAILRIEPGALYSGDWLNLYRVLPKRQADTLYTPLPFIIPTHVREEIEGWKQEQGSLPSARPKTSANRPSMREAVSHTTRTTSFAPKTGAFFKTGTYCQFTRDFEDGTTLRCTAPVTHRWCKNHGGNTGPR